MIVLITVYEKNEINGKMELITSHGETHGGLRRVTLPCEHPRDLGAVFNTEIDEWVIYEDGETPQHQASPKLSSLISIKNSF